MLLTTSKIIQWFLSFRILVPRLTSRKEKSTETLSLAFLLLANFPKRNYGRRSCSLTFRRLSSVPLSIEWTLEPALIHTSTTAGSGVSVSSLSISSLILCWQWPSTLDPLKSTTSTTAFLQKTQLYSSQIKSSNFRSSESQCHVCHSWFSMALHDMNGNIVSIDLTSQTGGFAWHIENSHRSISKEERTTKQLVKTWYPKHSYSGDIFIINFGSNISINLINFNSPFRVGENEYHILGFEPRISVFSYGK